MRLRYAQSVLVVAVMALYLAPHAFPQANITFAQLNGTVRDTSDHIIAGAAISVRDQATNQTVSTTSNASGFYVVPNLPPGKYELTVQNGGFAKYVHPGIPLTVGQTATVDVTMKVAAATEVVNVTTAAPVIEPTKTEISQVIDTQSIQALPTVTRQFVDFALLTPGVAVGRTSLQSTFTEPDVTRISFGGMRDLSNGVTVDGADYIDEGTGSQRATPSQEAVDEFRVVNNSFGTEYGRALGGIVNVVTKSGTNDLHGNVYGYLNNQAADSKGLLTRAPYDQFRRGQFGATLGGPIIKDRTFFFANYEGQRMGYSPTYPATLTGNLATINAAKAILQLPPEDLNVLKTLNNDNGFVRLDHQFNTNNRLTIHYGIVDARDLNVLVGDTLDGGGIGAPSDGHNTFLRDQSLVGSVNTVVKPDLVNTFMMQYARRTYNFPAVTGQPNLDIPNTLSFGHNFGTFDALNESREQISDSVAFIKSNHYLKFGTDVNIIQNFVIWPGFTPMRIILPSINCMVDFANYANPTPTAANQVASVPTAGPCPTATIAPPDFGLPPPGTVGGNPNDAFLNGVPIVFWGAPVGSGPIVPGSLPPPIPTTWKNAYLDPQDFYVHLNHQYFGLFFQDQWRINPKLTFNYGLRWDVETGLSQIINPDYRGWQPRVGFAYSPFKHTVIRTGFGIFDDHYNMTFLFVTYPQREVVIPNATDPGVRQGNQTATWVLNQLFLTGAALGLKYPDGTPAPFPAAAAKNLVYTGQTPPNFNTGPPGSFVTNSGGGIDPNSRISYSEQASLQVDQELKKGLVLSAGYLFLRARKQFRPLDLNVCPSGGEVNSATFCPPASLVTPAFVGNQLPDGKAAFSGPLYSNAGLMYFVDGTGNAYYNGGTFSISDRFGQYFRFAANYTISHTQDDGTFLTFVSTPQDLYDRKLERGNSVQDVRNRFVANFTSDTPTHGWYRNFEFNGIVTLQSSRPFTLFVGNDVNGDTNPVTDRVGWSPRNAYRGQPYYTVDLRLARLIHLNERLGLNLALDAFDVFNRQNINEVTSVYGGGTPDFCGGSTFDNGPQPKQYGDATTLAIQQGKIACQPVPGISTAPAPDALFGTPRTMFNPRQLQASVKFSF
jgi:Carboxypeptidase regulatory-like domain